MEELIRKFALQNAIFYKGKANPGAVISKVLGEDNALKKNIKEVAKKINEIVKKVNSLTLEQQKKELEKIDPEMLEKKAKEKKDIFSVLDIKEGDKIITAFPPEPSKYPHIGHAKAILLNYELAKKYNGKFILRFEDTNPKLAKTEFYKIHLDNYAWLGIKPDEVIYVSDYMKKFYDLAEKLIRQGKAYMCTCPIEELREKRYKGIDCDCRNKNIDLNLELWKKFFDAKEESMVLRLKLDMQSQNTTMRDPTIMRIIDHEHARQKKKYRVWPNYDFENAVMDGLFGVTHRMRSKEFEIRTPLQRLIQEMLGFKKTESYEFARFNLVGVESSGRIIREKVDSGELIGWDDPTLTTLVALRRRGFLPEAIKEFVLATGMTKSEATLTWDDLIIHNKRILEPVIPRYFFSSKLEKIKIDNASAEHEVEIPLHPEAKMGMRKIKVKDEFYIDDKLSNGNYRLIECMNFEHKAKKNIFLSEKHDKELNAKLIHWVSLKDKLIDIEIMMPDKKIIRGKAEGALIDVKEDSIVQFMRFGFCRLDKIEDKTYKFWLTH
ncbi:glutamate--tRNA ligase [Candidatus Woesearchaeota archaeon]|nr:glutamate--tRNA ligase [Candidatus Woesearchaeota archaeon]